jgi:hypothetical protein
MKAWRERGAKSPGILILNISSSIIRWLVDKLIKIISFTILSHHFFICNKLFQNKNFSKQKLVTLCLCVCVCVCSRVLASWIYVNNCPTRCNYIQFIYICKLLYMFRVISPPIIRSSHHCIHSIWTWREGTPGPVQSRSRQVAVTVTLMPDAVDTVTWAPDDGWRYHPKHVELEI